MKNFLDKLQRLQCAWQSQCNMPMPPDFNPDQLLWAVRLERRMTFMTDMFVMLILLICGIWMLWMARDIRKDWPWLIYTACLAWVVGFMLFNQWRRRRHAARYDEPMLAHVEWAIKDLEHRMWQDRYTFWWYTLPIALGCMIPPTIFFVMEFIRKPEWGRLFGGVFALLFTLGVFAAVFIFVHLVISNGLRIGSKARRRELEALRALRESLLNTEEPRV
jgi:hypothetical protein